MGKSQWFLAWRGGLAVDGALEIICCPCVSEHSKRAF